MHRVQKGIAVAAIAMAVLGAGAGTAAAHEADVSTPSGQQNCQFMGGPGNPNHPGHTKGHPKAQSHERSDTFDVGAC